jgi:hypothetical protein
MSLQSVRSASHKLSNVHKGRMGDQTFYILLAPPCFGRYVISRAKALHMKKCLQWLVQASGYCQVPVYIRGPSTCLQR